jgi:hypothetical protein
MQVTSQMRPTLIVSIAVLVLSTAPSAWADSPLLTGAISDYNAKQYNVAIDKLNRLELSASHLSSKDHTKLHYYLGLCNQHLSQMAAAEENYQWVADHGDDKRLQSNSQSALNNLAVWSQHRNYEGNGNKFIGIRPGARGPYRGPNYFSAVSTGKT